MRPQLAAKALARKSTPLRGWEDWSVGLGCRLIFDLVRFETEKGKDTEGDTPGGEGGRAGG